MKKEEGNSISFLEEIMKKTGMGYEIIDFKFKTTHSLSKLNYYNAFGMITEVINHEHEKDIEIEEDVKIKEEMISKIKAHETFKKVKSIYAYKEKDEKNIKFYLFINFKKISYYLKFILKEEEEENIVDSDFYLIKNFERISPIELSNETKSFFNLIFITFKDCVKLSQELRLKTLFNNIKFTENNIFKYKKEKDIITNTITKIKEKLIFKL